MPSLSDRIVPHFRRAVLARESIPRTDGQLLAAFVAERDPVAFEILVRRHGPMVYGVCRRVIGHTQTAEDAFQAVFVVLARRAAAVKPRGQLANWLFGVAYRTALKARGGLFKRRSREKQVLAMPDIAASPVELWADIQPILDAELAALPDKLRLPVVLCDLEGLTQREAARQLKLPPATLANRLAAARRTLAERLTAKGITLSGGLFATVLSANVGSAAVPTGVCAAAAEVGLSAIGVTAGVVPESVRQLSEGVLRMMMLTKWKAATALAASGAMLLGGFGLGVLPQAFAQGPPATIDKAKPTLGPALSDAEFLKRNCETLRGTPATNAELSYFAADTDANKRRKVVAWLMEPEVAVRIWQGPLEVNFADNAQLSQWLIEDRTGRVIFTEGDGVKSVDLTARWLLADPVQPLADHTKLGIRLDVSAPAQSDVDFLTQATTEARGTTPTKLEREYFLADQHEKKREKLLDLLLSDPAVVKKVGPGWKKAMLNPEVRLSSVIRWQLQDWSKLIGELMTAKKTDDQILEALTLAITGRLATDGEKKLAGALVAKQKEKATAWAEVAAALAGTDEAKKHAEKLKPAGQIRALRRVQLLDDVNAPKK